MERLRRLSSLWSWLPAFRAVAETQHLPTASSRLHVSASALSRTIRLLEDDLGQSLFVRHGRKIELNERGERLLVGVRDAMRLVHEGILSLSQSELDGPVYLSSAGLPTDTVLFEGLARLRQKHPDLVPNVSSHPLPMVDGLLLRGQIDVALTTHPISHPQLARIHLGELDCGIYCGDGHPLFRKRKLSAKDVAAFPFVALPPDEQGAARDGWPPQLERRVGAVVSTQSRALDICSDGQLLAVLPQRIAEAEPHRRRLRKLPGNVVPPTQIFAHHRRTLTAGGRAETVIAALRV